MKMTRSEIAAAKKRWRAAATRTRAIHTRVGTLATLFAGLEIEVIQLLAKLLQSSNQPVTERILAKLTFRQAAELFADIVPLLSNDHNIQQEARAIASDLVAISMTRNDVLHSTWIAYSTGDFGQHRARARGNTPQNQTHRDNPVAMIDACIRRIEDMYGRLCCFEGDTLGVTS